ncbi:MAG: XRE family transcriptional regulator, partial [Rhodobacteraceae bacterium]|nr:XRE family transcriptional regulator [Paracoccaceae bacterium]
MANRKLYSGAKLRDMRQRLGLTQKDFASKLGVSLPYLNQMENNNRPLSGTVILALAQEFGFDVTELSSSENERLFSDMREAFSDPIFGDTPPQLADMRLTASNAPSIARAFLDLHRAYRQTQERLASLDEALGRDDVRLQPSPWEEVRDFFHYCDNYIDAVDRAAEGFAKGRQSPDWIHDKAIKTLHELGITVQNGDQDATRIYDPNTKILTISNRISTETARFQILLQLALISQEKLLEATLDLARFQSPEARAIAKIGLANYFAGAALMPYKEF